jgi:hypothetical protein
MQRIRIYTVAPDGTEVPLGTFIGTELLEIFGAALKVLAEEGEALASLDGHTVLLRRVFEIEEATAGDYDTLLETCLRWFDCV